MILLDTDVCVELLRGNITVIERRKSYTGSIAVSFMTVAELYYGAHKSSNCKKNSFLIEQLLLSLVVIESDIEINIKFGELKTQLHKQGAMLADADLFIAATALTTCDRLITGNINHYKRITGLEIENWIR